MFYGVYCQNKGNNTKTRKYEIIKLKLVWRERKKKFHKQLRGLHTILHHFIPDHSSGHF